MSPRLEVVTPANVHDACRLRIRPEQERFVAPVAISLAEAYADPDHAWPRLIYEGDELVGFVMAGFIRGHELLDSTLWRLNVAASAQGRGYGRFGVEAAAEEARRRGRSILSVGYARGERSPEGFYLRLGFKATGRHIDDLYEAVASLDVLLATAPAAE
ncbi:MAG TPA: GNAT family N-acetyltransferase [Candidatus Limnocylindrales bacterium]|nr:GNAT family N-acetyltransferase [Candidatus Limnocylindrales bacterium]